MAEQCAMSTLTIRLPEDTHARMKLLARQRAISVNKLMEELCTIAVTQHDPPDRAQSYSGSVVLARASSRTSSCVIGLRGWWLRHMGLCTR